MFGTESADNLFFSVSASQLGKGLDEQLARFAAEHTDTKLIIIDTLQKVREVGGDNYSYANDYQIMARLKSFADAHGLCILLVHHTRKQTADDKFDMISGTSGLLGAADGAFLLQKENGQGMLQLWKYRAEISKTKSYILSAIQKRYCGSCKGQKLNCGRNRRNLYWMRLLNLL